MRYPYECFLRFLVSRKADVNRVLQRFGLPVAGGLWASNCLSALCSRAPSGVFVYLEEDMNPADVVGFLDWAETEGFRALWESQKEFGGKTSPELSTAFAAFANAQLRAVVGMLLLSNASPQESSGIMAERFNYPMTVEALEVYRTVFWDVNNVSREAWPKFIDGLETRQEKHYLAIGIQGLTADEIRYQLGLQPEDVDPVNAVKEILTQCLSSKLARRLPPTPQV